MSEITVAQLINDLKLFNPEDTICFGQPGHFSFNRTKDRGGVVQIEFNETEGVEYNLLPSHPENS